MCIRDRVSGDVSLPSAPAVMPPFDAEVDAPSVGGDASMPSVGDVSADIGAKVDDIAAKAPDMPSVEMKKPKKSLFSSLSFKRPSLKGPEKVRVAVAGLVVY